MSLITERYKGTRVSRVKEVAGIYAWYYRPSVATHDKLSNTIDQIVLSSSLQVSSQISGRYGAKHIAEAKACLTFGYQDLSPKEVVESCVSDDDDDILEFLKDEDIVLFSRPLYIGISKNLYSRTYEQHYKKLQSYWEDDSPVSKYLRLNEDASVQDIINKLDEKHSFALEARVKRIPVRDLMLVVNYRNDLGISIANNSSEKKVERLLHLMTDPVLGRR